ncbi:hypothetical protein SORBI_3004G224733 [Sorghum bicolor]|uniref:Uncharacterized protein n=1 Tax=Sorghum bicolor TaxID=4558 RepID=A0A1Z5RPP5_SORBI|nr:hypothetical protein SORBI_3004G224733 [Sorghum bicolor]
MASSSELYYFTSTSQEVRSINLEQIILTFLLWNHDLKSGSYQLVDLPSRIGGHFLLARVRRTAQPVQAKTAKLARPF